MHTTTNLHIGDHLPPIDATASPTTICVRVGYDLNVYGTRAQLIDLARGIQSAVFAVAPPEPAAPYSLGARVEWTTDGAVPTRWPTTRNESQVSEVRTDG